MSNGLSSDRRRLLEMMRERKGHSAVAAATIERSGPGEPVVLSSAQRLLWSRTRVMPAHPVWRTLMAVNVSGPLDTTALRAALDAVLRRHDVLRTAYLGDEAIPSTAGDCPFPLAEFDCGPTPEHERDALLERHITDETGQHLDPARAPLIRARLLRIAADDHLLLASLHRMAFDGWSRGVLLREIGELYEASLQGSAERLPAPRFQYRDYARWQQQRLAGDALRDAREYWDRQLEGAPTGLALPARRPYPGTADHAGTGVPLSLDGPLLDGLTRLARSQGVTRFMTLYAGWTLLLSRLTGQSDIVVAAPVAGRLRGEFEDLIGSFAAVLPLRTRLDGQMTVSDLLGQVKRTTVAAYAHQALPVATAPIPAAINLINTPQGVVRAGGVTFTPRGTSIRTTEHELSLVVVEAGDAPVGGVTYATSLFDHDTVRGWVETYRSIMSAMIDNPARSASELGTNHPIAA